MACTGIYPTKAVHKPWMTGVYITELISMQGCCTTGLHSQTGTEVTALREPTSGAWHAGGFKPKKRENNWEPLFNSSILIGKWPLKWKEREREREAYPLNSATVHKTSSMHTGGWQKKRKIERLHVFESIISSSPRRRRSDVTRTTAVTHSEPASQK